MGAEILKVEAHFFSCDKILLSLGETRVNKCGARISKICTSMSSVIYSALHVPCSVSAVVETDRLNYASFADSK